MLALSQQFPLFRLHEDNNDGHKRDDENTATFLRENNVSWVQIDEPKFQSSVAAEVPLTADIAYFRFHGRNKEMWWKGDSETRHKYLYSTAEIDELSDKVRSTASKTALLFAFFNNHWQGYAPRNAVSMIRSLGLPFVELPVQITSSEEDEL